MQKMYLTNIQDLIEIQRASFYKFMLKGIKNSLTFFENPTFFFQEVEELFVAKINYLEIEKISFKFPKISINRCFKWKKLTYAFWVYVPIIITQSIINETAFENKYEEQNKEFFNNELERRSKFLYNYYMTFYKIPFIKIPLFTGEGTFILNGCERIIVNQNLKRPGVYFSKYDKYTLYGFKGFKARIISSRNSVTQNIYLNEVLNESRTDLNENQYSTDKAFHDFKDMICIPQVHNFSREKRYKTGFENVILNEFPSKEYADKFFFWMGNYELCEKMKNFVKLLYLLLSQLNDKQKKKFEKGKRCKNLVKALNLYNIVIEALEDFQVKTDDDENNSEFFDFNKFLYGINVLQKLNINFPEYFDLLPNYDFNLDYKLIREYYNEKYRFLKLKPVYIGLLGRNYLNQKFLLNLPETYNILSLADYISIINELYAIKYSKNKIDDIDDISNKQVCSVGEILEKQIINTINISNIIESNYILDNCTSIEKLSEFFSDEIDQTITPEIFDLYSSHYEIEGEIDFNSLDYKKKKYYNELMSPYKFTSKNILFSIKHFFGKNPISQFADQINPLSTINHIRRVTLFGPEGLDREHVSSKLRDVNSSQYGKICLIESPEGRNVGLVTTLSLYSRVDSYQFLETPYLFTNFSKIFFTKTPIFLNGFLDKKFSLIAENFLISTKKLKIIDSNFSLIKKHSNFFYQATKKLKFLNLSPAHIISVGTSLIPFIEHNDGNRALMGSNMQRQALPIIKKQEPIVGLQTEFNVSLDSSFVICSYTEGEILSANSNKLLLLDCFGQYINYNLPQILDTNQHLYLNYQPIVWPGEKVFSGEIIANTSTIKNGQLALGQNLMVAYMPWEGYNFEDAIIINEKLITKNILTSLYIEEVDIAIEEDYNFNFMFNEYLKDCDGNPSIYKQTIDGSIKINEFLYNTNGILLPGNYVYPNSILIFRYDINDDPKLNFLMTLFEDKDNYDLMWQSLQFKINTCIRVPEQEQIRGRLIDVRIFVKKTKFAIKNISLRFYIVRTSPIRIGDKLSGRHGNKGIISRVLPEEDMPFLPDGKALDILLNPLGVPSRMNIGQVFECLLGITGEKLGYKYKISSFDEIYHEDTSRLLINTFLATGSKNLRRSWFFQKYSPGKILIRDGRTGEYFDNSILVGKAYILKLMHLVEKKINARNLGPYSGTVEQPLQGRANNGGQRFGEMEVWALEAQGATISLQELLTIKSDNMTERDNIYDFIDNKYENILPMPTIPEAFLVLINELRGLGLNIQFWGTQFSEFSDEKFEFDPETQYENKNQDKEKEINIFKVIQEKLNMIEKDKGNIIKF